MSRHIISLERLHSLVRSDPDRAWPIFLRFAKQNRGGFAIDLLEDFVYEHDEAFIDRIEAAALQDVAIRNLVEQAHIGGIATIGAERFNLLQRRLQEDARPPDGPI